jgi:hypothetical protein
VGLLQHLGNDLLGLEGRMEGGIQVQKVADSSQYLYRSGLIGALRASPHLIAKVGDLADVYAILF